MAMKTIETGKNYKILQEGTGDKAVKFLLLQNVRLSFPAIARMSRDKNDDGTYTEQYKGTAMLPKKSHGEAKDALKGLINELISANEAKVPQDKWCLKNGDDTEREEYQGHWIVNASDKAVRPIARDKSGERILVEADCEDRDEVNEKLNEIERTFFAGAIVDMLIRPWFFGGKVKGKEKTFPKRVSAGFSAIKFVKDDGTRFAKGEIDDESVWGKDDDDGNDDSGSSSKPKSRSKSDDDEL